MNKQFLIGWSVFSYSDDSSMTCHLLPCSVLTGAHVTLEMANVFSHAPWKCQNAA